MKNKELIIVPAEAAPLTKQQQKFNSLIRKIKTLQINFLKKEAELNDALNYYAKKLHPIEKTATEVRIRVIRILYNHYLKTGLSGKDKEILRWIISDKMHEILVTENNIPDELNDIFSRMEGQSVDEMHRERMEEILSDMNEHMEYMGIKQEPANPSELTDEELFSKLHEFQARINEAKENVNEVKPKRKKSRKLLEKEQKEKEKEDASKRTISSIYRSLAKTLHPDLERDPEIKKEKEKQMQLLTAAYEKGDLHALLKLELEWIAKEEDNIEKLTDEKLIIYNSLLNEQAGELEMEIHRLHFRPVFAPLRRYLTMLGKVNIKYSEMKLSQEYLELKRTLTYLESAEAGMIIKRMIKMARTANEGYY